MGLGEVFSATWKDYKKNFKLVLKAYWWFNILPFIIFGILALVLIFIILSSLKLPAMENLALLSNLTASINNPTSLTGSAISNSRDSAGFGQIIGAFVIFIMSISVVFLVISIISALFLYPPIYYASFYNEKGKMSFRQAAKGGVHYFWKFLGLGILIFLIIFLFFVPAILSIIVDVVIWTFLSLALKVVLVLLSIGLFILAIIFAIYFGISWLFSPYVLIRENTGVTEAMKRSKFIVKGNWWKVLGYSLLIGLIAAGISGVFAIPSMIIGFVLNILYGILEFTNLSAAVLVLVLKEILSFIFTKAAAIITVPASIFFFKNFYLEMRKSVKK